MSIIISMGRPKSYDHEQVLKKAMLQFWQAGFAETSLSDLETATSLNRYSLYKGFGDKEALFEQALEYYQKSLNFHDMSYKIFYLSFTSFTNAFVFPSLRLCKNCIASSPVMYLYSS